MDQQQWFNFKENWYWIGPIIGGILATTGSFAKERIEELMFQKRFKKNIIIVMTNQFSEIIIAWDANDMDKVKSIVDDIFPLIANVKNDFSSISVKYASRYYHFVLSTHDELKYLDNFLSARHYSVEQKKEMLNKAKNENFRNNTTYSKYPEYNRLNACYNNIYTSIQAFK